MVSSLNTSDWISIPLSFGCWLFILPLLVCLNSQRKPPSPWWNLSRRVSWLGIIYRLTFTKQPALPADDRWDRFLVFVLVPCHMIDNRSKVGGSIELNRLKALMVSFQNPLHAVTVGILNVAVLRETKAKHWTVFFSLHYFNTNDNNE